MTTINDIADLVRILQDDPAWAEALRGVLLSRELLNLPEELANFARMVRENSEIVNRRLEQLEGDVAELKAGQARLEGDVAEIKAGQARLEGDVAELRAGYTRLEGDVAELKAGYVRLEGDVAELKAGQARLEGDVAELKAGYVRLEGDVAELKAGYVRLEGDVSELKVGYARLEGDVAELKDGQAQLQSGMNRMRGEIGNLIGSDFQRKAVVFALRIARRRFGMQKPTLVHQADQIADIPITLLLDEAADDASVDFSDDDTANVERSDAIVAGQDGNGSDTYLLMEASVTVMEDDVAKARERAGLLVKATGVTTEAVVVGAVITEEAARLAQAQRVTFVHFDP